MYIIIGFVPISQQLAGCALNPLIVPRSLRPGCLLVANCAVTYFGQVEKVRFDNGDDTV